MKKLFNKFVDDRLKEQKEEIKKEPTKKDIIIEYFISPAIFIVISIIIIILINTGSMKQILVGTQSFIFQNRTESVQETMLSENSAITNKQIVEEAVNNPKWQTTISMHDWNLKLVTKVTGQIAIDDKISNIEIQFDQNKQMAMYLIDGKGQIGIDNFMKTIGSEKLLGLLVNTLGNASDTNGKNASTQQTTVNTTMQNNSQKMSPSKDDLISLVSDSYFYDNCSGTIQENMQAVSQASLNWDAGSLGNGQYYVSIVGTVIDEPNSTWQINFCIDNYENGSFYVDMMLGYSNGSCVSQISDINELENIISKYAW